MAEEEKVISHSAASMSEADLLKRQTGYEEERLSLYACIPYGITEVRKTSKSFHSLLRSSRLPENLAERIQEIFSADVKLKMKNCKQDLTKDFPGMENGEYLSLVRLSSFEWSILDLYVNHGLRPKRISEVLKIDYFGVFYITSRFRMRVNVQDFEGQVRRKAKKEEVKRRIREYVSTHQEEYITLAKIGEHLS